MKICLDSADGNILCQRSALEEGFVSFGHHVTKNIEDDVSFVFVGNPPYDKFEKREDKKIIFNVLDIPHHVPEVNKILKSFKEKLPIADKITSISKTVSKDIERFTGLNSEVIYYPMKKVSYIGYKKYPQFKVLMCGRLNDPNKRTRLAISSLIKAGFNESEVAIVGGEYPGWGTYLGLVQDEVLNNLYNSVDYVLMCSKNEGIGLPAIEAACAGAIPIVMPDMSTFDEFWVESPLGIMYQCLNSSESIANLLMYFEKNKELKENVKMDMLGYATLAFKHKFDRVEVAKRIIECYHTI